jgi:hypothetical protein
MSLDILLGLPVDIELWIILFYVVAVLAGARIVEVLARVHFARAQSYGKQGLRIRGSTRRLPLPARRIPGAAQRAPS